MLISQIFWRMYRKVINDTVSKPSTNTGVMMGCCWARTAPMHKSNAIKALMLLVGDGAPFLVVQEEWPKTKEGDDIPLFPPFLKCVLEEWHRSRVDHHPPVCCLPSCYVFMVFFIQPWGENIPFKECLDRWKVEDDTVWHGILLITLTLPSLSYDLWWEYSLIVMSSTVKVLMGEM